MAALTPIEAPAYFDGGGLAAHNWFVLQQHLGAGETCGAQDSSKGGFEQYEILAHNNDYANYLERGTFKN
ncbi:MULTISPECIES: hypothetical protein [unclassified Bradyrhizobium]|uniref:hypothetical protein n=1 Tax=unclassified Bradyrhizobium TaxID=2631580 RepID=UPI001CD2D96C|nr:MULTISPECIES: hypothetical protein [unclassified Bradyrhizobium]MCA1385599.1 hypothetical protein [Bradyrhizobium sp. BRP05]MCA1480030.1 hypothetical protein [Bradyrhizobium sp. NBAIM08]MCA1394365.1 hypothetical protein [Bradyrhizobium sp. IC3123]MCA1422681.1 hypothetical protein [Bradyrhizobium sp. BRP23]MCA1429120.1 hypothetical protein [Bradyrhizobium sp. NBAIM16]